MNQHSFADRVSRKAAKHGMAGGEFLAAGVRHLGMSAFAEKWRVSIATLNYGMLVLGVRYEGVCLPTHSADVFVVRADGTELPLPPEVE